MDMFPIHHSGAQIFPAHSNDHPAWIEKLNSMALEKWLPWIKSIPNLAKILFARHLTHGSGKCKLIIFCNASKTALGAVCCIRTEVLANLDVSAIDVYKEECNDRARGVNTHTKIYSRMAFAKAKVSTLDKETAPRLELKAARIGMLVAIKILGAYKELNLNDIHFFSDSQTVNTKTKSE